MSPLPNVATSFFVNYRIVLLGCQIWQLGYVTYMTDLTTDRVLTTRLCVSGLPDMTTRSH